MSFHPSLLAGLLAIAAPMLACAAPPARTAAAPASLAAADAADAPVFVVMARSTYAGLQSVVHAAQSRSNTIGTDLVIGEVRADQLDRISEYVHEQERRCGGYFAFATRKQAEAFLAGDRTAAAITESRGSLYTIDNQATVDAWLPEVEENNVHATIAHLSSYQNRYYASAYGREAAVWIRDTWAALAGGREDASAELFEGCANCSAQPSVILTVQGSELPDEVVVIGGHLDSISNASGGNDRHAPGADDDASGIATITEVIRVAMQGGWKPKRTVKFMGYAAEEVGLYGSKAIAQKFQADAVNVVGVLQLDMTNYNNGSPADMRIVTDFSNAALKTFFAELFDHYLAPLGLVRGTDTCGYACSDHASWTAAGYPSAMMFEAGNASGAYFPWIHSVNDTLANMDDSAANSAKFAQFALAFLGELAKTHDDGAPGNVAPVADFSFSVDGLTASFTDASSDSDGVIVARLWDFGDDSTSTVTNPVKTFDSIGTHIVTLTVTDDGELSGSKTAQVSVSNHTIVLVNNEPADGLPAQEGASQLFTLDVPVGAADLGFIVAGRSGEDADLRIEFAGKVVCESNGPTANETCIVANPTPSGTYTAIVQAHSQLSRFTITGRYTEPAPDPIFADGFED